MAQIPTARQALSRFRLMLEPDADIVESLEKMVSKRSQAAPVLDEDKRLIGLLTEKDCLRLLANSPHGRLVAGTVREYMSPVKATLTGNMDLFAMAEVFLKVNFPLLPVLDGEKVLGCVTRWVLLRQIQAFERELENERRRLEKDLEARERPTSIDRLQKLAGSHSPRQLVEALRNRPRYSKRS